MEGVGQPGNGANGERVTNHIEKDAAILLLQGAISAIEEDEIVLAFARATEAWRLLVAAVVERMDREDGRRK